MRVYEMFFAVVFSVVKHSSIVCNGQSDTVSDVTNLLEELTGILQDLVGRRASEESLSTTTIPTTTTTTPNPNLITTDRSSLTNQDGSSLTDVSLEVTKLLQQLTGVLENLVQPTAGPTTTTSRSTTSPTTTSTTTTTTPSPTTTTATTTSTTTTTPTPTTATTTTTTTPTTTSYPGPLLENTPLDGNLEEGTDTITTIKCLTCSGDLPYSVRYVSVSPSTGCGNCFNVWDDEEQDDASNYCLKYVPGSNRLDYEKASVYTVTVECVDSNGKTSRGVVEVRILPNSPPTITSPTSVSVTLTGKTPGSPVYRIQATDPNDDDLFYTLTHPHNNEIFQIDSSGQISLRENIENSCETSYSLSAYVTDSYNDRQGPVSIGVDIDNPNKPPTTDLLNKEISVDENGSRGTRIVNLGLIDATSHTMHVRPSSMIKHFDYKDGQLTVNESLNFEQDNKANISFTFSNGHCESHYWLVVNVNDINDEPELSPPAQNRQVEEGFITFFPEFTVNDEDFDDSHTFQFASNQGSIDQFSIDPATGVITSNGEFDLDDRGIERDVVVLPVKVVDAKGNAVDTATVTLTVTEVNDNEPEFPGDPNRQLTITECDPPHRVMTATATDKDFGRNGEITYSSSATGEGPLTVTPSGAVYLTDSATAGENYILTITAHDRGSPSRSSGLPLTVSVVVMPCTTTPPPTTLSPPVSPVTNRIITNNLDASLTNTQLNVTGTGQQSQDFFGDSGNIFATVMAGILGLAVLGLLSYLLWKFCCPTCCGLCLPIRNIPSDQLFSNNGCCGPSPGGPSSGCLSPGCDRCDPDCRCCRVRMSDCCGGTRRNSVIPARYTVNSADSKNSIINDGRIYDFWKEHYNEANYQSTAHRQNVPSTI